MSADDRNKRSVRFSKTNCLDILFKNVLFNFSKINIDLRKYF